MPTTLGNYILGRTLGSGVSCKVKLAKDENGTRYAIKILHQDEQFQELVETEVDTLTKVKHANIVNMIEVGEGIQRNSKKNAEKQVKYIVLELVGGGELFDLVALGGKLEEKYARFYFKQLMDGLQYLHSQGVVHRDLKPENLMLDSNFNLKIADFGFAAPAQGRDGSGFLETQLGTASYMAPEIHLGKSYSGEGVDLFAASIILFVILTQRPPFSSANPSDPHYRLLAANRGEIFWQAHKDAEDGEDIYSPEFKDLFEKMMQLNPAHRPKLDQILAHPWMQGEFASDAEVQVEFKRRKEIVDQEAHNEREEKRNARHENNNTRVRRGAEKNQGPLDKEDMMEYLKQIRQQYDDYELNDYDAEYWKMTSFFTSGIHVDLFLELQEHLDELNVNYTVSDTVFKIKFDASQDQVQNVFNLYIKKLNDTDVAEKSKAEAMKKDGKPVPASVITNAQRQLLETPEAQAIISAPSQQQEETKEESKEAAASTTCIIELFGVKKMEQRDNQEESKENEDDEKITACCVDFSYRNKTTKKPCDKQFIQHFKAWKALLNSWVNMASAEI